MERKLVYNDYERIDLNYFNKFITAVNKSYVSLNIPGITGCYTKPTEEGTTYDMLSADLITGNVFTIEFKGRDATARKYDTLFIEPRKFQHRREEWEKYRCPSLYINFIEDWKEAYVFYTHLYPETPYLKKDVKINDPIKGWKTEDRYLLKKKYAVHLIYDEENEVYKVEIPFIDKLSMDGTLKVNVEGATNAGDKWKIHNKTLEQIYRRCVKE